MQQKHYPLIKIDNSETDIIQLWQQGKEDTNVIQIEREKIPLLIDLLQKRIKK